MHGTSRACCGRVMCGRWLEHRYFADLEFRFSQGFHFHGGQEDLLAYDKAKAGHQHRVVLVAQDHLAGKVAGVQVEAYAVGAAGAEVGEGASQKPLKNPWCRRFTP